MCNWLFPRKMLSFIIVFIKYYWRGQEKKGNEAAISGMLFWAIKKYFLFQLSYTVNRHASAMQVKLMTGRIPAYETSLTNNDNRDYRRPT